MCVYKQVQLSTIQTIPYTHCNRQIHHDTFSIIWKQQSNMNFASKLFSRIKLTIPKPYLGYSSFQVMEFPWKRPDWLATEQCEVLEIPSIRHYPETASQRWQEILEYELRRVTEWVRKLHWRHRSHSLAEYRNQRTLQ